jgi:hypothetical protein
MAYTCYKFIKFKLVESRKNLRLTSKRYEIPENSLNKVDLFFSQNILNEPFYRFDTYYKSVERKAEEERDQCIKL